jgi:hypothetical protein
VTDAKQGILTEGELSIQLTFLYKLVPKSFTSSNDMTHAKQERQGILSKRNDQYS